MLISVTTHFLFCTHFFATGLILVQGLVQSPLHARDVDHTLAVGLGRVIAIDEGGVNMWYHLCIIVSRSKLAPAHLQAG